MLLSAWQPAEDAGKAKDALNGNHSKAKLWSLTGHAQNNAIVQWANVVSLVQVAAAAEANSVHVVKAAEAGVIAVAIAASAVNVNHAEDRGGFNRY